MNSGVAINLRQPAGSESPARLAGAAALIALLLCVLLQIWRPYFFLTNDNLTQWMPPIVEIGRNFHEGKPPYISASLFGGGYDWRSDASIFPMLSPLVPLLSPLAASEWYFLIVDLIVTFEFIVIAGAFAFAATWLRSRHQLPLSEGAILVASLSYAFGPLTLLFGSSWMGFANAQAAWPLVFVAMQFASIWRSAALTTAALAFSLFGGNLHPFIFLLFGCGCCAIYFSATKKSLRPVLSLAVALVLLALVALVVIGSAAKSIPAASAIRSFSAATEAGHNVPPWNLLSSFLFGPFSAWAGGPPVLFGAAATWSGAIAYSLINIPTVVAIARGGWRTKQTRILMLVSAVLVLVIWRPLWLAELFTHTPGIRFTRWPFREVVVLLFFVHLLFLFNYQRLSRRWQVVQWTIAALPLIVLIGVGGPPTMGNVELSRRLIISGLADAYWKSMKPSSSANPIIVASDLDRRGALDDMAPYPLLPSHNFAALFGVKSLTGYSTSTRLWQDPTRMLPPTLSGIYTKDEAKFVLTHLPASRLTVLHSVNPPVWTIAGNESARTLTIDPDTLVIETAPTR